MHASVYRTLRLKSPASTPATLELPTGTVLSASSLVNAPVDDVPPGSLPPGQIQVDFPGLSLHL